MDYNTMAQIGFGGGIMGILAVLGRVLMVVNHRTLRSRCCGRSAEIGIDVDSPPRVVIDPPPPPPHPHPPTDPPASLP